MLIYSTFGTLSLNILQTIENEKGEPQLLYLLHIVLPQGNPIQMATSLGSPAPGGGVLTLTWYTYMCLPFGALFREIWYSDRGVFIRHEGAQIT